MQIAIDVRTIARENLRGIGQYVFSLLAHWPEDVEPPVLLYSESDGVPPRVPDGLDCRLCGFSMKGYRLRTWTLVGTPWHLRRLKPDVFHAPANYASPWQPVPTVVTVHDAMLWEEDRSRPDRPTWYYDWVLPRAYRRARRIITASDYSRRRLEHCFPELRGRIRVIHHGVDSRFQPMVLDSVHWQKLAQYGVRNPYVLCVAGDSRRKRASFGVEVFADASRKRKSGHQLAILGLHDRGRVQIAEQAEALGIGHDVLALPFVAEEDMPLLYNGATAVVIPTIAEGFGFPLLEAMACGSVCVASRASSLTEVGGDGALLLEPLDEGLWIRTLRDILTGVLRRSDVRETALRRAAQFNWEKTISETFQVYREAAGFA